MLQITNWLRDRSFKKSSLAEGESFDLQDPILSAFPGHHGPFGKGFKVSEKLATHSEVEMQKERANG